MAHYIGKYNTEDELKIALTNGSLLEPYVAAVGTGSSVSVYYSSDPSPVQPYVCEYYANTATTISSSGGSFFFYVTANTPYTLVYMDNGLIYNLDESETSEGAYLGLTIPANTSETQNHYNVRIDYMNGLQNVVIKSDSFVVTQAAAASTYLCTATYTTTEAGQAKYLFSSGSQVLNSLHKIVVDGVAKNPARKQTFETAGVHTVDFYASEASVSAVSTSLFSGSDVETIVMSEDVTTLTGAFCQNTSSLTSFTGANITSITYRCFLNSTVVTVEMPRLYEAGNQCFAGCTNISSDIISGLTVIGNNAFSGATFATAVVNSGVTQIGYSAFQLNTALTSCEISRVTILSASISDSGMFNGCTSLTGFTYPNEWVQSSASTTYPTFKNCSAMTEVTFGTGMTAIGSGMFSVGNDSLVTIKSYAATAPTLGGNDFDSITGNTGTLYVPAGSDYSTWSAALGENWTVSDTL